MSLVEDIRPLVEASRKCKVRIEGILCLLLKIFFLRGKPVGSARLLLVKDVSLVKEIYVSWPG
jgi:hypothetical protein